MIMSKEEAMERFKVGISMFNRGLPFPIDTELEIEQIGWSYAEKFVLNYQKTIDNMFDTFCKEKMDMTCEVVENR